MAWVTEYDMTWRSGTRTGNIVIQRDGGSYIGSLKLDYDSLEIENTIPGWNDPIARSRCSFTIINEESSWHDLLPLMTIENGEYRVVVDDELVNTLFVGYINVEAVDQDMMFWSKLTITASGLLSKLEYVHPDSVDTKQYISLIDLIDDCLVLTGETNDIKVSCDLYETTAGYVSATTLFNRTAVFTELFWKNNIERASALDILRSILIATNCYLFWSNGYWYITHYMNLSGSQVEVQYTAGTSAGYGFSDTGSQGNVSHTNYDIWSKTFFKQMGDTQRLTVIPGFREIEVKLDDALLENLVYPDLTNIVKSQNQAGPYIRREWYAWTHVSSNIGWYNEGDRYKNIENSIRRYSYDITYGETWLNGLTTRFVASITEDSVIVITFKFGLGGWASYKVDYDSVYQNNLSEQTIRFYWFLATYVYPGAEEYFMYDADTDTWYIESAGDPDGGGDPDNGACNKLDITFSDLDKDLGTYTGTLKIRIGEVISDSSADLENIEFVFRMGQEKINAVGYTTNLPGMHVYYGDFKVAVNDTKFINYYKGEINTDFLEKKTITMKVFDGIWQSQGALVVNDSLEYLTSEWEDHNDPSWGVESLARWLLIYKFKLHTVARQIIEMDIYGPEIPPFSVVTSFIDSKQSNKLFILLSNISRPESNIQTLKMYEYNITEDVTLT